MEWEDEQGALRPDVGMPPAVFSSLPISGGDSNEEARDEPKIEEDKGEIVADDAGGCKDPVEAAAAAAAIFKIVRHRINFVLHMLFINGISCHIEKYVMVTFCCDLA